MHISTHLVHFMLILHTSASQRKYASDLPSLIKTLSKTGLTAHNISEKLHYNHIEKLPPLAYIPSDLRNFHHQLTHSWFPYSRNKANPTAYPPTNVNPSCNSFTYNTFHWSPLQWTSITDSSFPNIDFQMLHFKLPSQTPVTIARADSPRNTITIPHDSLHETFLFMSKILSYFYEKYTHMTFKLFTYTDPELPTNVINCTIGLYDLLSIQEVIKPQGETRVLYTTPCILEKIIRIQKLTWTEYAVHFSTSRIRNTIQQPLRYFNSTTREQTLTFQWPYINQTTFKLIIRVSQQRKSLPKIWWILPYTKSLLTLHKNLFAPPSIKTRTTTYSYTFQNKHHYVRGGCIAQCKHKKLHQKVRQQILPTTSWPLPTKNIQGLTPTRFYCLPQCGTIENHMKLFHKHVPSWWPPSVSDKCTLHILNFTKPSERQRIHFSNLQHLNPSLNNTIYTYETNMPIEFSGPLQTFQYELSHLHKRMQQATSKFTQLWQQTYPQYKKLETIITESLLLHDDSLIHQSELLYYTNNERELNRNTLKMSTAAYLANYNIDEFKDNYYQLNEEFKQLQEYAEQIYSFKYMTIVLQAIQNRTDLQPNVIYSHKFYKGFLQSKPIMRILTSQLRTSLAVPTRNNQKERIDIQQTSNSYKRSTVRNSPNLKSTLIASKIALFSTELKPILTTPNGISTVQIINTYPYTSLPYQTLKTLLNKIVKSFMYFVNHSHFLYNSVHITMSPHLRHVFEVLTAVCK